MVERVIPPAKCSLRPLPPLLPLRGTRIPTQPGSSFRTAPSPPPDSLPPRSHSLGACLPGAVPSSGPVHPAASGQSFLKARRTLSARRVGRGLRACVLGPGQLWPPLPRSPSLHGATARAVSRPTKPLPRPRPDPSLHPGLWSDVTAPAGDRGLQWRHCSPHPPNPSPPGCELGRPGTRYFCPQRRGGLSGPPPTRGRGNESCSILLTHF